MCLEQQEVDTVVHLVGNFDGASRGNPGPSSCGGVLRFLVCDVGGDVISEHVLWEGCELLGVQTNWYAEVAGAHMLLRVVLALLTELLSECGEGLVWSMEAG